MTAAELEKRARRWLEDANALLETGRLESAVYLCGYAVEFALKARICKLH
jgi:HEPN domain-containing protein